MDRGREARGARPGTARLGRLSEIDRKAVLAEPHSEAFVDCFRIRVYPTLRDEGTYLTHEWGFVLLEGVCGLWPGEHLGPP